MPRITMKQALKRIFSGILGRDEEKPEDDGRIHCPKCNSEMQPIRQYDSDFILVFAYRCPKCNTISELTYENKTNKLLKEFHSYDKFENSSSSFIETVDHLNYNQYALDRLWLVMGLICYPVLVKSEFTSTVSLVFVRCDNDVMHDNVEGFIVTDGGVIGFVRILRNQRLSFFCNPYLARLPHSDYSYISYPSEKNASLEYLSSIRFRHRIDDKNGLTHHELTIIKDFALQCYGMEFYIRFTTVESDKDERVCNILRDLDFQNILFGKNEISPKEGYSIQTYRLTVLNGWVMCSENISLDLKNRFYLDVKRFFDKLG